MAHYGKINGWVAVQPNQHLFCFGADYKPGSCRQQQHTFLECQWENPFCGHAQCDTFARKSKSRRVLGIVIKHDGVAPYQPIVKWLGVYALWEKIKEFYNNVHEFNWIEGSFLGPVTKAIEYHWFGNAKKPWSESYWLIYQVWFWARNDDRH